MTSKITLYKVLDDNLHAIHGGLYQYVPGEWTPPVKPCMCQTGYHICRGAAHLLRWLGPQIWGVETRGTVLEGHNKICAESIRLIARVETWTGTTARLFAADCAAHVSHLLTDDRSRAAVIAARQFARGEIDEAARGAAWSPATAAVWAAAGAWEAARAAAREAAWSAARTWAATREAAWSAARASTATRAATREGAVAAAWSAARAAAWATEAWPTWAAASEAAVIAAGAWAAGAGAWAPWREAARAAAVAAEVKWQVDRLRAYLRGDELTDVPIVGGVS